MTEPADTPPPVAGAETVKPQIAATPETRPASVATPKRSSLPAVAILFLLLLAVAGTAGGFWWNEHHRLAKRVALDDQTLLRLQAQTSALEAQASETATRLSDLSRLGDRNGRDIAALQARIDDSVNLLGRISEDLAGGRTRFQLASIEQLLLLANDRLLLQRDVKAALSALDSADARLAQLSDPQLFAIREALATERTALRAVPVVDLTSAALSLDSLISRVPQLPLAAHAPSQFESPAARDSGATGSAQAGWNRLWQSVKTAVASLFTIRRDDNARVMRLLPPEGESVVYHVLILRLDGARAALLGGNTVAMREQLHSASDWLESEFKADDPGVLAAGAEIERLQALDLSPPLPDISRSLVALRARLDAAGAKP